MRPETRPLGRCAVERVQVSAWRIDGCERAAWNQVRNCVKGLAESWGRVREERVNWSAVGIGWGCALWEGSGVGTAGWWVSWCLVGGLREGLRVGGCGLVLLGIVSVGVPGLVMLDILAVKEGRRAVRSVGRGRGRGWWKRRVRIKGMVDVWMGWQRSED